MTQVSVIFHRGSGIQQTSGNLRISVGPDSQNILAEVADRF